MSKTLEELKQEAGELGLKVHHNIGADKLAAQIEAHYAALEAESLPKVKPAVKEETSVEDSTEDRSTDNSVAKPLKKTFAQKMKALEKEAKKLRKVTIIDNDPRVNNQTTTVTVSCGNEYYDLGTVILPLNDVVEVAQGHINVLKSIEIPMHRKSPTNPQMSVMVMGPRYSVSFQ